jgi:hypothetical protein
MHMEKDYDDLMTAVQRYINCPEPVDFAISDMFTDTMYQELRQCLAGEGVLNLEGLDSIWTADLMQRKAVSGFLKDASFGEKRLISMPDRITSSVRTEGGETAHRPSPITGYADDMEDMGAWWPAWRRYMFGTAICVRGRSIRSVFSRLEVLPRPKYPMLSEAEEALSVPLQALCLALFDAALTRILSAVAPGAWQPLKRSLHAALFDNKAGAAVAILAASYADADVIFVQEASEAFAVRASASLGHAVVQAC